MSDNFFKELFNTLRLAKKEYGIKLFTSVLIRGILLVIPILYSESINKITQGKYNTAILFFVISIIVTLLYRFMEAANQYTYYWLYNRLSNHYTNLAIAKTNDNSIFSLSRFDLGQYTNTVVADVDIISTFLANLVMRVVQILEYIIIFIYFYFLNFYIFLSVFVISIVMIIMALKCGDRFQRLNASRKSSLDRLTSSIHEYFLGIKEIKSFNLYDNLAPNVKNKTEDYLGHNSRFNIVFQNFNQLYLFIFELFRLGTMIYGVYLISTGSLAVGILLLVYNYYQKIIDNYATVLTINVEVRSVNVSLNRFYKLVEYSQIKRSKDWVAVNDIKGDIKFKDILYGYRDNPILNNVTFSIPAHGLSAITGLSGSGKSGIFELLLKLNRQHEGDILIDNKKVSEYRDEDYFNLISSATKTSVFFRMSIKDNLSFVSNDMDHIIKVCKSLGLHELIINQSEGYDTLIDNNSLNEQTRQLLAIARVLIKDSKIMLFDDAISGLDKSHQKKVMKILDEKRKDHTILIITHDDDILSSSDKIILLKNHKTSEYKSYRDYIIDKKKSQIKK